MVDENLPPVLADSLSKLFRNQHQVIGLRKRFGASGIKDLEWIEELGREGGWCVLTADRRIARNHVEKNAFLSHNLIGFVLAPSVRKKPVHLYTARILQLWDVMTQQSELVTRGLFELPIRSNRLKPL